MRAISKYKSPGTIFGGRFFEVSSFGGLYLEGLNHGGAYFWNFTVVCI